MKLRGTEYLLKQARHFHYPTHIDQMIPFGIQIGY